MKLNLKHGLAALAGLGLSANVAAVDFTCSDITFSPEAFAAYEFVDQACRDIIERDGNTYAKLTAKIIAQRQGGTHYRFYHADGEMGPSSKAGAHAAFLTGIEGEMVALADYPTGADVNVYVPKAFWTLPVVEEMAEVQEMAEETPPPPPPAPEPEPEPEPQMLPTTASALPWLALFGALFLVLGGALRFSRR
jgi:hypothetical protein